MKKIFILVSLIFISFSAYSQSSTTMNMVKAFGDPDGNGIQNYSMNSINISTGEVTELLAFESAFGTCAGCSYFDGYNGQYFLGGASGAMIYDVGTNTVSSFTYPSGGLLYSPDLWNGDEVISVETTSAGETVVQMGQDAIADSDGDMMISTETDADGDEEIHIGENSLITVEKDGVQQLWAENANGDAIDINIKEGTNLLIDDLNVSQEINSNKTNIATNTTNIASNTTNIATNTSGILNNSNLISQLDNRMDTLENLVEGYTQGIASSIAMSQFDLSQDGFSVGVGMGKFQNVTETALGFGYGRELNNGRRLNVRFSKSSDSSGLGFSMSFKSLYLRL
jgi:hypothetical protein